MIKILDTTLREGEQTPGVFFSVEEKIEIAKKLDEIGVDIIETGHPGVSKKVYEAVKAIGNLSLNAETLAHIRARKEDVDMALECNNQWIGVLFPSSELHLKEKLNVTKEEAVKIIEEVIRYAKNKGFKVRYSPEDTTRSNVEDVIKFCKVAEEAGADRISVIDTVGTATPESFYNLVKTVKENIKIPLNVHCHDDFGLALANTIAGIKAGATMADVCINGLGERAGITDMAELIVALKLLYKNNIKHDLDKIFELSKYVEKASGIYMSPLKPITGENAFSHKSGIHTNGVLKNPKTYEAIDPKILGRNRKFIVDRYAGRAAVREKLAEFGIKVNEQQILEITNKIKEFGDAHHIVHDTDILDVVEEVTGRKMVTVPQGVLGLVLIKLEPHIYTTTVLRRLANIKGMGKILELAGEYEISALINADNIEELNNSLEEIRAINGVLSTDTRIVMKKYETENGNNN